MQKSQCNEEEIKEAWKNARSIESKTEEDGYPEYIGELRKRNRIYRLYKSENGKYWYATRICIGDQEMSEYEAIFGKAKPSKKKKV